MPDIDILVPYATKNYIKNPSFETNTTGWTAVGSAISAVLTRARFERKALQVVTDGVAIGEGVYYRISDTSLKGNVFASIYVRGAGKIRLRLVDGLTGTVSVTEPFDIHDNYFQRYSVQGIADGSNDLRLYIETANSTQVVTFYVDGAMVEQGQYLSSYCDGGQEGCRWDGVSNASTSQRSSSSPSGGRWVSIRDDECNPNVYITTFSGFGLPQITINRQRMALSPGSYFDSMRAEEGVIQFTVNVVDYGAQRRDGNSKYMLNKLRQHIIDLVKPDRDPNSEPMWMRYRDGDRSLMIRVNYEGGLEFQGDMRNKWHNTIPLRFLALDPFWYEDSQEVHLLDTETVQNDNNLAIGRIDGAWQFMGNGLVGLAIRAFAEDANGRIYAGGSFTLDGDGNNMRRFAYLSDDFSTWVEPATGLNGEVYDILAHPNGKIYLCGSFTGDNDGNTYNRIVEYDPDTDTFAAMGSGLADNIGQAIDYDKNGDIYVVGTFSAAGGVTTPRVAKWDGGTWHSLSNLITDIGTTVPYDVIAVSGTEVYICGSAVAAMVFAKYDGTSWATQGTISSSSATNYPYVMKRDADGSIVLGLVNTNPVDLSPAPAVARWNGSSFEDLGFPYVYSSNYNPDIYNIAIDQSRRVFVSGSIPSPSQIFGDYVMLVFYNGTSWAFPDVNVSPFNTGASYVSSASALFVTSKDDLLVGLSQNASVSVNMESSGFLEIESKSTAFTFPIITFSGSGRLVWLENQKSGQIAYLDYDLQENEIFEIDYRIGKKSVKSNYSGYRANAILPQSDDIVLLPSNPNENAGNKIACYVTKEVAPVVQLRYQPTHWSVDGISKQ